VGRASVIEGIRWDQQARSPLDVEMDSLRSSGGLFNKHNTSFRARIAAVLGKQDEAITLLQQNLDMGPPADRYLVVHRGIDFEFLQDDPEFQEFMRPKG
jgi:hypothetical protein